MKANAQSPSKMVQLEFSVELLEEILAARRTDFVQTNCPQDVKVIRVVQTHKDRERGICVLFLESKEADWKELELNEPVPLITPFEYTVVDPESPPPTEEKPDG